MKKQKTQKKAEPPGSVAADAPAAINPNIKKNTAAEIIFPELKGLPDLGSKFVRECPTAKEKGNGLAFAELCREKFFYVRETQDFYCREILDSDLDHGVWRADFGSIEAERAVELVALLYLQEAARITAELEEITDKDSDYENWLEFQKKALSKAVDSLRTERGLRSTLKFARSELAISADQLDSNPYLLVCRNGTIELDKAAHFRPGQQEERCTKCCNTEWHGLDCVDDLLEKISLEIHSGNQAVNDYFWRWLGRALIGDSDNHELLLLIGAGRNGKSLLLNAISATLGDYAGAMPADLLIEQRFGRDANAPNPIMLMFKGLRLALFSETGENQKFSTTMVKFLTGGDNLIGRGIQGKTYIEFPPSHSMVLCTNNRPKAPASDYAFWQRVRMIEYLNRYVTGTPNPALGELQADVTLPEKLKKCGPAILAKLVRGCLEAQRDGLNPPPEVTAAVAGYRDEQDIVKQFLEERCEFVEGGFLPARESFKAFKLWFQEEISDRFSPPSQKKFAKELERFLSKERSAGNKVIYVGARLRPEYQECS